MRNLRDHPCFNLGAKGTFGRVHVPVAPKCNVQCLFCNRKFDCVNESRPGVTSTLLSPGQAVAYVRRLLADGKPLSVVGIAGPGDPFANAEETMETLRSIRREFPEMLLCVSSNGLAMAPYIPELADLGVTHATVTISAVDPAVGEKIYGWVRDRTRVLRGRAAAGLMLTRQLEAVRLLKANGLMAKVNSILIPGVNDEHMPAIAEQCRLLGVDLHNIIPLCPVPGTPFEAVVEPSQEQLATLRAKCGLSVSQMTHCQRCRADACGLLCEGTSQDTIERLRQASALPVRPAEERPYVAVATREGLLVNLHLGEAEEFHVFRQVGGTLERVEVRKAPPRGGGDDRWEQLAASLDDCRALLVSDAGPRPTQALQGNGVRVVVMEGLLHDAVAAIFDGQPIRATVRVFRCGAGKGCSGDGTGCG